MKVIGLEVSTSSAKAVVFSLQEGVITEVSSPFTKEVSNTVSQDPTGIWEAALKVLKQATEAVQGEVVALGLAGTWHSMLLLDKERNPLERIRTWADISAGPTVSLLRKDQGLVREFYRKTGCMVNAIYPVWKYYHLKSASPDLVQKTAYLSSQIEYVFTKLTGQFGMSKCTASGSGFFNIHTLEWDEDILSFVGLKREQLGNLYEATYTAPLLPNMARQVGLPSGIPVTVGCADGALNQVGIGGAREKIMSFSVGTSGALRIVHSKPVIPEKPSTWCYYLYNEKRLAGAATNNAANCIDWFLDRMGQERGMKRDYRRFDEGSTRVDLLNAPFFLPFLFGERSPGWQEERRGGFVGVKASHTEYDLYYSIMEGVLFNLYQCYRILSEVGGEPEKILISGGIVKSTIWLQMAADIFGRELSYTGQVNDSTVGAALFALQAAGGISKVEDYRPSIQGTVYPRKDTYQLYQERFQKYLELYEII